MMRVGSRLAPWMRFVLCVYICVCVCEERERERDQKRMKEKDERENHERPINESRHRVDKDSACVKAMIKDILS